MGRAACWFCWGLLAQHRSSGMTALVMAALQTADMGSLRDEASGDDKVKAMGPER